VPLFDLFWAMLWFFVWIAWIMLLIRVFADIFRSDKSGGAKAIWALFVVFLPFLGAFVYLMAEGGNMAQRDVAAAQAMDQAQRDYIRDAAGSGGGTAAELEKLAALRDKGVLSDSEFQTQKAKVLS